MITLELISAGNAMTFKDVRLRALQDTPSAFSATYADEAKLTDADWIARASQRNGKKSVTYLAMDAGAACGIAAGFFDETDATLAHLVSMWVAPTHRRRSIGWKLVEAIIAWARVKRARSLQLIVTSNNEMAIKFYQSLGFTLTGKTAPYRNDPTLDDLEMVRPISA